MAGSHLFNTPQRPDLGKVGPAASATRHAWLATCCGSAVRRRCGHRYDGQRAEGEIRLLVGSVAPRSNRPQLVCLVVAPDASDRRLLDPPGDRCGERDRDGNREKDCGQVRNSLVLGPAQHAVADVLMNDIERVGDRSQEMKGWWLRKPRWFQTKRPTIAAHTTERRRCCSCRAPVEGGCKRRSAIR
jgi:hypothetical protein